MFKQYARSAFSAFAAAALNVLGNSWELVFEPAFRIVAAGVAIALLAVTVLIVASVGNQAYTSIALMGASFGLYMTLTNFEPPQKPKGSATFYEAQFFTAGGMIFITIVVSMALAATATGAPIQIIIPAAITAAIVPGVGMLTGVWLMVRLVRGMIWIADNVIFKVSDRLTPGDGEMPPMAELFSIIDEDEERRRAAAAAQGD